MNGICSLATFASNGKFTSDLDGPSGGKWSGGEATIHMKWNDTGPDGGLVFNGTYGAGKYSGSAFQDGISFSGQLVKGAMSGC